MSNFRSTGVKYIIPKQKHRARIWNSDMGAGAAPLKLGRKHLARYYRRRNVMAVAEREKRATGAPESG